MDKIKLTFTSVAGPRISRISYDGKMTFAEKNLKWLFTRVQLTAGFLLAKHCCPLCNHTVKDFLPLPDFYTDNLRKYGWKYKFEDSEFCNVKNYLFLSVGPAIVTGCTPCILNNFLHIPSGRLPLVLLTLRPHRS